MITVTNINLSIPRDLIWKLLTTDMEVGDIDASLTETVKTEACRVVTRGLRVLYHTPADRHRLLHQLLVSGNPLLAVSMVFNIFTQEVQ